MYKLWCDLLLIKLAGKTFLIQVFYFFFLSLESVFKLFIDILEALYLEQVL